MALLSPCNVPHSLAIVGVLHVPLLPLCPHLGHPGAFAQDPTGATPSLVREHPPMVGDTRPLVAMSLGTSTEAQPPVVPRDDAACRMPDKTPGMSDGRSAASEHLPARNLLH